MTQAPTATAVAPAPARHRRPAPTATASNSSLGGYHRHIFALAKRSLIKTWRTPEALIDVTLQPIIFLVLFTYIFGGAIGGTSQDYLQFLLPGLLGQSHRVGRGGVGPEPQLRHREGRLRPVPVAADRSIGAIGRRSDRGHRPVPDPVCRHPRVRHAHRLPDRDQPDGGHRGDRDLHRLRVVLLLDLGVRRDDGAHIGSGAGRDVPDRVAVVVRQQHLCQPPDTMPSWLQTFVKVNPISQLVTTVRGLMIGGPVAESLMWTLVWMAILLVVFVPLALRGYRRRA